jgi:hypothetical protein
MDNFTDKSSEVIKASFDLAEEKANSQGEFSKTTRLDTLADVQQSTRSISPLSSGTTLHHQAWPNRPPPCFAPRSKR